MSGWFLAFVAVAMGWQAFEDGPLAHYITEAALCCALCIAAARGRGAQAWAVFGYGALTSGLTAGCGALYAARADGRHFLCDRGSAMPVSLLTGLAGIAVAVFLLKKGSGDG